MKIFVGMSGGVDSSVSAYLLQKEGYEVEGVFMKNWSGDNFGIQADCPWERDQEDAQRVCEQLGIPFRSFNFEKEYRTKVVEYFFAEYKAGRTPNPDVMCNKEIKFNIFLDRCKREGADMIATGHYVRRVENEDKTFDLHKGIDTKKDQSYFLCAITQDQLASSIFPVGFLEKSEVREIAHNIKLPNADKPDSQGICFIGEINVREFLKQGLGEKPGLIVDIDTNRRVGEHSGAWFFTIGQREGLKIGGTPKPYFVAKTDVESNTVYVCMGSDHPALFVDQVRIENLHQINPDRYFDPSQLSASVRYRHRPQSGKLQQNGDEYIFTFDTPQRAVTPGQSLVIYDEDICVGSGVII